MPYTATLMVTADQWRSANQHSAIDLGPLLQRSRKLTGRSTPNPRIAIQQHRVILEAIRRRDPDIAEQAMRTHLQTVGLDLIAQSDPGSETDSRTGKEPRRKRAVEPRPANRR